MPEGEGTAQEGKYRPSARGKRQRFIKRMRTSDIVLIPLKQPIIDVTFGQSLH